MFAILKQEIKLNFKSLLIWALTVGGLGFVCTLMYESMEGEMAQMADMFSHLGAFSDAFGMSTLSISTLAGFFATEVGTVHGLGSAMYAAFLASCILSKEEDGHTGEFLYSLPVSRGMAVTAKCLSVLVSLVIFTVICGVFYVLGFGCLGEEIPWKEMCRFLGSMLLMNVEVSAIALCLSACSSRNRMGVGLGLALVFYTFDLIGRVVPTMKDYLFLEPFSFTNASEIFAGKSVPEYSILVAVLITAAGIAAAYMVYLKRDLAS